MTLAMMCTVTLFRFSFVPVGLCIMAMRHISFKEECKVQTLSMTLSIVQFARTGVGTTHV